MQRTLSISYFTVMKWVTFLLLLFMLLTCQQKTAPFLEYTHPIPFAPHQYVCYYNSYQLTIDGLLDDPAWMLAPWSTDFVDIEGNLKQIPAELTHMKMLWDSSYLYVGAELEEKHLWARLRQRDTVIFYDNDFEIFIDPDGDTHNYYEIEWNAFNTVWDLFLSKPYRDEGVMVFNEWNAEGILSEVSLQGTINQPGDLDSSWTLEIAIPWSAFQHSQPRRPSIGDQWRMNFSRVEWDLETIDGSYQKKMLEKDGKSVTAPEQNWVWSPQGYVAMHMPEMWGYVQFAGTEKAEFNLQPDEPIKWALRQLYYLQKEYREKEGCFTKTLNDFKIPEVEFTDYQFKPRIESICDAYVIYASSIKTSQLWVIRQDGKIWRQSIED